MLFFTIDSDQALAKRNGGSVNFLIEARFRMAIQCFDGKTTDLSRLLAQQHTKPTKERDLAVGNRAACT